MTHRWIETPTGLAKCPQLQPERTRGGVVINRFMCFVALWMWLFLPVVWLWS